MKYTDLVIGKYYRCWFGNGFFQGGWVFHFVKEASKNNIFSGPATYQLKGKYKPITKNARLHEFKDGWTFEEATPEEIKLFTNIIDYEIY